MGKVSLFDYVIILGLCTNLNRLLIIANDKKIANNVINNVRINRTIGFSTMCNREMENSLKSTRGHDKYKEGNKRFPQIVFDTLLKY